MRQVTDDFLEKIRPYVNLHEKRVLEIGCGNGSRSVEIAALCQSLIAIEPNVELFTTACSENLRPNITYGLDSILRFPYDPRSFDVTIFTLSLHHIPEELMARAIDRAVEATHPEGAIIFLEPWFLGPFFSAEQQFDACDGDERANKAAAYRAILNHPRLEEQVEITGQTTFQFDSPQDFMDSMRPQRNTERVIAFLRKHKYQLKAPRRITVCTPAAR
ncbi:MAG: class I SAM-dependent methyltransferase [Patescibacteria group bacterium]